MIAATQPPASSARAEAHQHRPRAFGGAEDADRRLGDDAELALGADDEAEKIVARRRRDDAPPMSTMVPSISTICTPSTLLVVTPYFRQCAPPEFMAMLPAMVQASWLDGSGA